MFVVLGSNGQLGQDFVRVAKARGEQITSLTHAEVEVTDATSVQTVLSRLKPRVVVNTTAAHGAQQATSGEQAEFFNVNALGAWHLARWCWQNEATLVHYSTDYVFGAEPDRAQPYTEADVPCPVNLYGASKLAGEKLIAAFCPQHYILRIASVYGAAGARAKNNSNFVKMTLGKIRAGENMKVVNDQWMSPTWTKATAEKTLDLLAQSAPPGLYHLAGQGACTWYDFAREIVRLTGDKISVEPAITTANQSADLFLRPRYTALDNANLRRAGLGDLPTWAESLQTFMQDQALG